MISIPWSHDFSLRYVNGFQLGNRLAHQVCYFDSGAQRLVSEKPSAANASPVSRTAYSFFESLSRTEVSRNEELIFDVAVGQHRHTFHRPPFSSQLSFETGRNRHGVALSIRHVLDTSAPQYLSSHFSISFSETAWALGLGDFLGVSEYAKFDVILSRAFRHIGLPDDTDMDELWGRDRQQVTMEPQPLVPGGPGVAVAFDRLRPHDDGMATRLAFTVDDINPLGPYLPGGVLQLWRLAERIMAG
ncbi:MAG TPA: hypothetical protein VFX30_00265 [bacterium]|nr:hypothetical protein [bacterium]